MLRVGLIGFGFVGQGVYEILTQNAATLVERVGHNITIPIIVVRNPEKYKDWASRFGSDTLMTTDPAQVLENPDIDVVVEVIGGEHPAFEYIERALKAGKYVVTANKEVIAKHKDTFFKLAKAYKTDIYFEASVGGGIPIIRSYKVGYAANQITAIYGILNGTTNYILTKIQEEKKTFNEVLAQAQQLGFAEADPAMDISGLDAAYKLVILAAVAFKVNINVADVVCEGIEGIQLTDIEYADQLGFVVKLLAVGRYMDEGKMRFSVMPTLIPKNHPLATVRNEFNAIYSIGNMVGESLIYGKGAGGLPTGSAVVSDILDIAFEGNQKNSRRNLEYKFNKVKVAPRAKHLSQFYLRVLVDNTPGVLSKLGNVFAAHQVNLSQFLQKESSGKIAEIVIITEVTSEGVLDNVLEKLKTLNVVQEVPARLRLGFVKE
ncbi:MAG: homoserine dehydrogenase [bacterium]|nr:homoserine dehydrogenase [bacterium]